MESNEYSSGITVQQKKLTRGQMTFHLDRIGCGDVFEIVEKKPLERIIRYIIFSIIFRYLV